MNARERRAGAGLQRWRRHKNHFASTEKWKI